MYLSIVSRRICSVILLGTEVRLTSLYFLRSSFFSFLKMGVMSPLFQSVPTSLDCHNCLNMMDKWISNLICQFHQDPWMHLIRSHEKRVLR